MTKGATFIYTLIQQDWKFGRACVVYEVWYEGTGCDKLACTVEGTKKRFLIDLKLVSGQPRYTADEIKSIKNEVQRNRKSLR